MLISIVLCSIIYFTQNTPLRVGAVPSFGNDTDKPPTPRAFCVMEEWRVILNYEGYYEVSNFGNVRRMITKCGKSKITILKPRKEWTGYLSVSLCVHRKKKWHKVHRLVCAAFLINPENKPFVNHKNGIKHDNQLNNLEWVTKSENQKHSYDVLGQKAPHLGCFNERNPNSKPVVAISPSGQILNFPSAREAGRQLGIGYRSISNNIRRRSKVAGGYIFNFAS